jgi:hypothetical protein
LAGTVPVALAACKSFPAYLWIAWQDFVDNSANTCCDGEWSNLLRCFSPVPQRK